MRFTSICFRLGLVLDMQKLSVLSKRLPKIVSSSSLLVTSLTPGSVLAEWNANSHRLYCPPLELVVAEYGLIAAHARQAARLQLPSILVWFPCLSTGISSGLRFDLEQADATGAGCGLGVTCKMLLDELDFCLVFGWFGDSRATACVEADGFYVAWTV